MLSPPPAMAAYTPAAMLPGCNFIRASLLGCTCEASKLSSVSGGVAVVASGGVSVAWKLMIPHMVRKCHTEWMVLISDERYLRTSEKDRYLPRV